MAENGENNAQLRGGPRLRRHDADVRANDAQRAQTDPAVMRQWDVMREEVIAQLEITPNGTPEDIEHERELCRTLRTIKRMRTGLALIPQRQKLKEAAAATAETPEPPPPYVPGIAE